MSRTRRGLLAEWPFRWMWTAESVSKLGDSVTVLALPLLAIITLEATPLQVGIIGATQFIPMLAFGLYAGVWVDRHRPRQVMIVADVVRGVALATVPLAFFIGRVTLTHLLVVAFVHATASTFGDVAIASYVPRLVGIDRVVEANSRLELSRSAVQVLGPNLAGLMVGALGAPSALLLDALSFGASAGSLSRIKDEEPQPADTHSRTAPMTGEIKEAVRFVAREPHVRAIVATASINNLSRSIGVAVLLIYLSRQVGQGPYPNGRIFKLVLNENDPLKFDSLSILIDADTSLAGVPGVLHNPDNIETTANSIMIQEDPGSQNSFLPSNPAGTTARIWRYNLNTGALTVVANVNQSLTPNANLGAWESSGIVDVSEYFGPGAFLVDIQAHGVNVGPTRMIGSNLERMEGGQLLLIKVPGA